MTNILRQILHNHAEVDKLHLEIEGKAFLQRYLGKAAGELTLTDHYRHLRQLKHVYDTFTELMTSGNFTPQLPEELAALLQRGKNIQLDLDFLGAHVTDANKDDILPATRRYTDYLRGIPLAQDDKRNNELLINFLIAILGDLNGGQFLKTYVRKLYTRNGIYSDDAPDNGVRFYSFARDTTTRLTEWLKTFIPFHEIHDHAVENIVPADENSVLLGQGAVKAFTMQAAIVDELELTRIANAELKPSTAVASHHASLFSCNSSWKIAAASAALVAASVAATTLLKL